ncbi:MAG: nucleoside triphosphate pyrophosphohydrolase family protein [Gemmatimonadota bacterium]|nr:nucleoside triphosphate pyrophosphohydrolase family protein [Gemmatimonadota bacterium]
MTTVSTLDEYQAAAARTINPSLSDEQRLLDAAAGLAEEAGEVLGHVRKHLMQGRPLDREAVANELGDALWCIAIAARCLDLPLSSVAARNVEKLRGRYPKGFSAAEVRE